MTAGHAVDTSVAVAALDSTHEAHVACRAALVEHRPALAGHALAETFSVLTRLPPPLRLTAADAATVIRDAFGAGCPQRTPLTPDLLAGWADLGIGGGAVYDALVAVAALDNDRLLLTRDRRAERTYRRLGVDHRFVG